MSSSCASSETLEQLLAGSLADDEAGPLREHLTGCLYCQAALDRLSDDPDLSSWAAEARRVGPAPDDTPELGRLLESLRDTPGPATALADLDDARQGSLGFLGPPEEEGDLGALGQYRVLAELGRGGMGIVLKAFDKELARTVALKVLRWERTDAKARARFVREARAAAGLNHDHVVPVHAVVNPPDAPPYLVMPYVAGPTLRERIVAERSLDPRAAARIGAEVADGLAAAHRAGLIHRDIKPANIILAPPQSPPSEGGEPTISPPSEGGARGGERARIMDFGLVRVKEQSGGTTQEGTIPGTPEYMSPEQIRAPDKVDERSDVYSLGVTLYEALTGAVPFRGTPHMVLQQVLQDEPVPPRRLSDRVPRDLETICLKAMAKEPARRYRSALEFRDDLRRWLHGEPIQARPVGRVERLGRWCQRRPALAALTAALLLVVAGGFGGVTWQWLRADRNHDLAEERRRKAHQAIHDYFTLVSENKLLGKPGLQELRKDLLESALRYYQDFLREWGDDPAMQAEVAATYVRVAAMQDQIGQPDDAKGAYQQALALYEKLIAGAPADAGLQATQARAYARLGDLLSRTARLDDALAALERARSLQEKLADDDLANFERRSDLARTHLQIGVLMDKQDRRAEARAAFEQARVSWLGLVDADPGRPEFRSELAATCSAMSNLAYTSNDWDEALRYLEQARDLFGQLVREHATVAEYQAGLADSLMRLTNVYNRLGRLDEAIAAGRQMRDIRERLAYANPAVTEFQFRLALAYAYLGKDLGERPASIKEALANCEQAFPLLEKLLRITPGHPDYSQRLADLHLDRGHYLSKLDQPAEALPCFEQARVILEELVGAHEDRADYRHFLGVACHNHGNELQQVGRRAEARQAFARSGELYLALAAADPKALVYQEMQARVALKLAGLHRIAGEPAPAAELARQALTLARKLHEGKPQAPRYEQLVANCCTGLGETFRAAGQHDEAERLFQEALSIREKFVAVTPPMTDAHLDAARVLRHLAELHGEKQPARALILYERCRARCAQALQANPLNVQAQSVLGQAWDGVGFCQAQLGRPADALRSHEAAAEHHKKVFAQSPTQIAYRERLSDCYEHLARTLVELRRPAEAAIVSLERRKLWPQDAAQP